jgi:endonuclease/exonuclease/phosphatase family metal-dependent hydrolase
VVLSTAPEAVSDSLVFASYNLRNWSGGSQNSAAKPEKSRQAVIRIVREISADLLGVCEMGSDSDLAEFRERLRGAGMAYDHVEYLQAADPDRRLALLSRFPFASRQSRPDVRYVLDGKTHRMLRGILDVTVAVGTEYRLRTVGVHLKSKTASRRPDEAPDALVRRAEAAELRRHLSAIMAADPTANVLCYGDFNDTKNEPMFEEITGPKGTKDQFRDLSPADSLGDRWTHYWQAADAYARIDFLFVNNALWPEVDRNSAKVVRAEDWLDASDHRPLTVRILNRDQ